MDAVTLVAYIIAIAIPAFAIYLFIALDVFGTGRISTILMCLGWGAIGAFFLAYTINNAVLDRGIGYDTLTRVTAPILEEILKAAILIYLVQHPRFRYIVDGAVYGFAVGIGFALSENIFIYIPDAGSAALGTAITRTLSTALMHATASGLVGLSLGRLRRSTDSAKNIWPLIGILFAISLHIFYNNIVGELSGMVLLLVAVGIGIGGGVFIGWQISEGLADEKRRFAQTLGMNVGVSTGERMAVQNLGGAGIEKVFSELNQFFGDENISNKVRRLLVIQANVGILQNNLTSSPASDRLKEAWKEEIAELRAEIDKLRKELGTRVNIFMDSVFPSDDNDMQQAFNEEVARFDPTLVHTFDMFMRSAELAETFTPEMLAAMAERLNRIDIFSHVSLANLENLSRAIDVMDYQNGTVLFNEGDQGDAMYMIEEGAIDIFVEQDGGRKLLRTFGPGEVVGEFSLLDGQPRSASAQSKGTLRALRLQRQVFLRFIGSRPQVIMAMLQYLAEKLRYTTLHVEKSVSWMTEIAQGTYQPAPAVVPVTPDKEQVELEPAAISEDTLSRVEQVFAQAAVSLQQREQMLRSQS